MSKTVLELTLVLFSCSFFLNHYFCLFLLFLPFVVNKDFQNRQLTIHRAEEIFKKSGM